MVLDPAQVGRRRRGMNRRRNEAKGEGEYEEVGGERGGEKVANGGLKEGQKGER